MKRRFLTTAFLVCSCFAQVSGKLGADAPTLQDSGTVVDADPGNRVFGLTNIVSFRLEDSTGPVFEAPRIEYFDADDNLPFAWQRLPVGVLYGAHGEIRTTLEELESKLRKFENGWEDFKIAGIEEPSLSIVVSETVPVDFVLRLALLPGKIYVPLERGAVYLGDSWRCSPVLKEPVVVKGKIRPWPRENRDRLSMSEIAPDGKVVPIDDFTVDESGNYLAIVPVPVERRSVRGFPKWLHTSPARLDWDIRLAMESESGRSVTNSFNCGKSANRFTVDFSFPSK